jgi:hypothetical protein
LSLLETERRPAGGVSLSIIMRNGMGFNKKYCRSYGELLTHVTQERLPHL